MSCIAKLWTLTALGLALGSTPASAQRGGERQVYINRTRLPADTLQLLEQLYRTRIPDGRYWYDRVSGAWGLERGPTQGFTLAGLPLGGPLPADISGGGTGVFINNRELPPADLTALVRLTGPVQRGRYWVDAEGNAGLEGGPAMVNLRALAGGLYRQGSGVGENHGAGAGAYGNLNTGIGIITDGQGGAVVFDH